MANEQMANQSAQSLRNAEPVKDRAMREVAPPVDIFESETELLLVADLPGVESEGLRIDLEAPELRIEGVQREVSGHYPPVAFVRTFRVDDRIDPDGISAELNRGVLRVHLKKSDSLRPRRIAVRSA